VNPALPGGALGDTAGLDVSDWATGARIGYAYVPYGRLQQGTAEAPNPSGLAIDVHLGTVQSYVVAPTRTMLDVQLPFGSLVTETLDQRRTDSGVGDLEVRARQAAPLGRVLQVGGVLGAAMPTGAYVERSGAANLPPEASYLTLGRGAWWGLAELDLRAQASRRVAVFGQFARRQPLTRTRDEFAWGAEHRATVGAQVELSPRATVLLTTELLHRGGASEPDPFSMERLPSANAGGWQWSVAPAASFAVRRGLNILVGARLPLVNDVRGNQLVPQLGGFVALSFSRPLARMQRPPAASVATHAVVNSITVVDYWATWCAPCKRIDASLEAARARWPDVRIVKIDATEWPGDSAPSLPAGVTGLPAIEVFDATGARVALLVGEAALDIVSTVDALRARSASSVPSAASSAGDPP
jgi:thioredoxin 1